MHRRAPAMNNSEYTFRRSRSSAWTILLAACIFALLPAVSVQAAQSVEDFLKIKPRWPKLIGTTFRIEGRVSVGGGTTLRLSKLPLFFISKEELPELPGPALVVEVVGRLRNTETGILEFELLSLKKTESDLQRVNRLRVDLPRDNPQSWYELGDWATNRVRFYRSGHDFDKQLTTEATELYRMAIRKERTAMSAPTYKRLKDLALKSDRYGLGGEFKLPMLYEAHFRTWDGVRDRGSSSDLASVAVRIAQELPDAEKPIDEFDDDFVAEWRKGPVSFYMDAPDTLRPQLHRLLYQQVMLESIERDAAVDGKNGDQIAMKLKEFIPEFRKLAAVYRAKELEWRVDHVNELSRDEALTLKKELIAVGDETRADKVFRRWFQNIEIGLRQQGATGLVELADEYESLFDDGQTAVQLLLESDRLKPGSSYVEERLEGYGYVRIEGRWRRKGETLSGELSPIDKAITDRRVIRGMTSAHVRKALGQPDSISRVLTSREVLEYWLYNTPSGVRVSVRLSRPVNRHEGIVRRVFDLPAGKVAANE